MKENDYIYISPLLLKNLSLSPTEHKIALWLLMGLNDDNTISFSSIDRDSFIQSSGIKKSTFHNAISKLNKKGLISRIGNLYYGVNRQIAKHPKG